MLIEVELKSAREESRSEMLRKISLISIMSITVVCVFGISVKILTNLTRPWDGADINLVMLTDFHAKLGNYKYSSGKGYCHFPNKDPDLGSQANDYLDCQLTKVFFSTKYAYCGTWGELIKPNINCVEIFVPQDLPQVFKSRMLEALLRPCAILKRFCFSWNRFLVSLCLKV